MRKRDILLGALRAFAIFAVLFPTLSFSTIGPCGSCPGCSHWWMKVPASTAKIDKAYHVAEKKSAKYYTLNILPLEVVEVLSERMVTRMIAKIEMIDRLNVILREEITREQEKQTLLRKLLTSAPSPVK